jgi:MFS family permease
MTVHAQVFLLGLFGVPLALLACGHRIRKRSARARRIFLGAVIGHCLAGCLAITFALTPPEAWTSDQIWRGFAGLWSLLVFPVTGAFVGMATPLRTASEDPQRTNVPLWPAERAAHEPSMSNEMG